MNRECDGKVKWHSRRAAKAAIRRTQGKDGRLRAYVCSTCGFFHVGHPSPAARAHARARQSPVTD